MFLSRRTFKLSEKLLVIIIYSFNKHMILFIIWTDDSRSYHLKSLNNLEDGKNRWETPLIINNWRGFFYIRQCILTESMFYISIYFY